MLGVGTCPGSGSPPSQLWDPGQPRHQLSAGRPSPAGRGVHSGRPAWRPLSGGLVALALSSPRKATLYPVSDGGGKQWAVDVTRFPALLFSFKNNLKREEIAIPKILKFCNKCHPEPEFVLAERDRVLFAALHVNTNKNCGR